MTKSNRLNKIAWIPGPMRPPIGYLGLAAEGMQTGSHQSLRTNATGSLTFVINLLDCANVSCSIHASDRESFQKQVDNAMNVSRVFCQAIRVLHSSIGLNHFGPTLAWGARQWMVRCYLLTKLFGAARHCCLNYKSHGTIPVIGCCFWIHGEE